MRRWCCQEESKLITTRSLERFGSLGNVDLAHFYIFRASRILPCLGLALALIVGLGLMGLPSFTDHVRGHELPRSHVLIVVLSVLTFWHNVLMGSFGYFNYAVNIYWSLSVEEVFYLVFPLICVLLKRKPLILLVWGVAIVLGPIYRSRHVDNEITRSAGSFSSWASCSGRRGSPTARWAPWSRSIPSSRCSTRRSTRTCRRRSRASSTSPRCVATCSPSASPRPSRSWS
jgi:hypothetical protein